MNTPMAVVTVSSTTNTRPTAGQPPSQAKTSWVVMAPMSSTSTVTRTALFFAHAGIFGLLIALLMMRSQKLPRGQRFPHHHRPAIGPLITAPAKQIITAKPSSG